MPYVFEGENVYYEDNRMKQHLGTVNKTETIRIDNDTVADVIYQFDLQAGVYVEQSRVTRNEPLPPVPPSTEDQILQLKAENDTLNQQLAQTNADAVAFQEFIFEKFPELA